MTSLRNLLAEQLSDIHSAETQISKALPKLVDAASDDELKDALAIHLDETRHQIERLEQVFRELVESPSGKECVGMRGLLEEGEEAMEKKITGALKDALLIAGAQRVEHYEISAYGTAIAWAKQLDLDDIVDLLDESLDEEAGADERLTAIAEGGLLASGINQEAAGDR